MFKVPKRFREEMLERWRRDLARRFPTGPDPVFKFIDPSKIKVISKESNDKQTNGKD